MKIRAPWKWFGTSVWTVLHTRFPWGILRRFRLLPALIIGVCVGSEISGTNTLRAQNEHRSNSPARSLTGSSVDRGIGTLTNAIPTTASSSPPAQIGATVNAVTIAVIATLAILLLALHAVALRCAVQRDTRKLQASLLEKQSQFGQRSEALLFNLQQLLHSEIETLAPRLRSVESDLANLLTQCSKPQATPIVRLQSAGGTTASLRPNRVTHLQPKTKPLEVLRFLRKYGQYHSEGVVHIRIDRIPVDYRDPDFAAFSQNMAALNLEYSGSPDPLLRSQSFLRFREARTEPGDTSPWILEVDSAALNGILGEPSDIT